MEQKNIEQREIKLPPYPIEPKLTNRFEMFFKDVDIPSYLFRGYKIYNDSDKLFFETSFYEPLTYTSNPTEFFNIRTIRVDFLDASGNDTSSWEFCINGMTFENELTYEDSELFTYKFKFEIDKKSFKTQNFLK